LTIYPTGVWLKCCGTVREPGENRENKPQPVASEETGLLDSIIKASIGNGSIVMKRFPDFITIPYKQILKRRTSK